MTQDSNNVELDVAVAKLEVHLITIKESLAKIEVQMQIANNDFDALEKRVAKLESEKTFWKGKLSGIVAVISVAYILIKDFFLK